MPNLHETKVSKEAVAMAFELLLGRSPENEEVVESFTSLPDVATLINHIRSSAEYRLNNADRESLWSEFPAISIGYMSYSIPTVSDFYQEGYKSFLQRIDHKFALHRKLWEFAYIEEKLNQSGSIFNGARGLGFGCGKEPLPSLFASRGCSILATDAPSGLNNMDWSVGDQFATKVDDLYRAKLIRKDDFYKKVSFEPCDMNNIPPRLNDFDFCWSACCLEHLGSIRHGLDFIINSVEKCLKVGGVACHTTEFNLSSNDDTLETRDLSLFRRRDIEDVCSELTRRGHEVAPLNINLGASLLDHHVDLPPFGQSHIHLKLKLEKYACTSLGVLIKRGK